MSRERRERLGIPIHDTPEQHTFSDGFCTCGEADPDYPARRLPGLGRSAYAAGTARDRLARRRGRKFTTNLDRAEGNREEEG